MTRAIRASVLGAVVMAMAAAVCAADLPSDVSGVASVVDGDTLDVGAVTVRLHGVDAPEAGQRCERADGKSWACGLRAADRLASFADGRMVRCAVLDRDQYARLIGRCATPAADGGVPDVGRQMVREGLAWAFTRFSDDYVEDEADARARRVGIWQGAAEAPWDYRAARWSAAAQAAPDPRCPIKGNISWGGERIYHTPWSPWYDRTSIRETDGERWFCDEAEARGAGWRAARFR
jgi:endonuclease YncB( thermonuclease family)